MKTGFPMLDEEIWLPAVGWEGVYEISSFGRVKRLPWEDRSGFGIGRRRRFKERIMQGRPNRWGYIRVDLCHDGSKPKHHFVHVMVLTAFREPCPEGMQTRHLDGDRGNNRLNNLEWGTFDEQFDDKRRHGTFRQGRMFSWTKLSDEQVIDIRAALAKGVSGRALAKKYNVWPATISKIKLRQNWKQIPG